VDNLPADYYADNFYPQVHNLPYMRYGAFVQVWATRYGEGRVIGFTDSTQLSNFCAFEPGKSELQMGMIEWLNRRDAADPRTVLLVAGALALLAAVAAGYGWTGSWVIVLTAGLLGWAGAVFCVNGAHAAEMTLPPQIKPLVRVVMDRTVSAGKLPMGGFISGQEDGFGIFEMWILRLGYFNRRLSAPDEFTGNLLIFAYPTKPITDEYRAALKRYVVGGGHILVIDSAGNKDSTASSLLWDFENHQLAVQHEGEVSGLLTVPPGWPTTQVTGACTVSGGQTLMSIAGKPVAAFSRCGKGSVTVIGFGSRFADLHMGVLADVEPNAELQAVYELEYALLRGIVQDTLPGTPATAPATQR
jgi:hypothetical protein